MLEPFALASYLIAGSILLIGVGTFLRNSSSMLNRLFALFCISIGIWIISNYAASNSIIGYPVALIANKVVLAAGLLGLLAILGFLRQLTDVWRRSLPMRLLTMLTLAVCLVALSPLVVSDITKNGDTWDIIFGPLALIYFVVLFVNTICVLTLLIWGHRRLDGRRRNQVDSILFSALAVVPVVLVTNAIMPFAFDNYQLTQAGSFTSVLIVLGMANGIIRHGLFDIRLVIVRTLAYALAVVSLFALYGGFIFVLTGILFETSLSVGENIMLAASVAISGVLFQPMRRFFDKTTNRLFYRDAYDPQELFGHLNNMLVSSLEMKYLMMQSVSIIETALKPDYALVDLRDEENGQRIFSSRKMNFAQKDIDQIRRLTPRIHQKVVVVDYLEDVKYQELRELMQRNKIAVLVRLTQNLRSKEEGLGYLMLGPRKSGNPYNQQDIKVLNTVANELIIAIQNALHFEEIQNFNVTLQQQVDDATRKLRRTNEKLKALDETKDDFISMASHQLRTPLTSVKGYLSMVLEGDAGSITDTQRKMLGQAFVSSQRMVYLIADLLNVSRLRTGKFVIEPAPTDLSVMIQEELAQLVETASARDLQLTYKQPKNFPTLMLDETKTRQVVMNFIDNAIYYTPAGGHIRVELTSDDRRVELRVIDDGIGVPKSEQHHLFTKFYRAGNARKARPDGTGLGLFMAKKVIIAQGGSIIFESKEGQGSTFGLSFPLSKLAQVQNVPVAKPPKPATKK